MLRAVMLRVGYPESLRQDLLRLFPAGVELIPLPEPPPEPVGIDFWIAPPLAGPAAKVWPMLRGVTVVQSMMAGTDWLTQIVGPAVTVCNAQGAHNISTAEWAVAAILAMLKYLPLYGQLQEAGDWRGRKQVSEAYAALRQDRSAQFPPVLLEDLHGKRLLLVGYGDIGKTIEKLLAPFDVELIRMARGARTEPVVHAVSELDNLLPEADVVVLILPLTEASRGLIGAGQFARMKHGALVVNAARGPIVDTDALVQALHSGRIRAALDVTDPEPLPPEHPLWKCSNLLLTPHVAGSSPEFSRRAIAVAAEQVRRLLAGEGLRHIVQHPS